MWVVEGPVLVFTGMNSYYCSYTLPIPLRITPIHRRGCIFCSFAWDVLHLQLDTMSSEGRILVNSHILTCTREAPWCPGRYSLLYHICPCAVTWFEWHSLLQKQTKNPEFSQPKACRFPSTHVSAGLTGFSLGWSTASFFVAVLSGDHDAVVCIWLEWLQGNLPFTARNKHLQTPTSPTWNHGLKQAQRGQKAARLPVDLLFCPAFHFHSAQYRTRDSWGRERLEASSWRAS